MPGPGEKGGRGGRKVPAAHNSKSIHGIEIKFGRVVENHKLINLEFFNWQRASSLRHNDVISVENLDFMKTFRSKLEKLRDVSNFEIN